MAANGPLDKFPHTRGLLSSIWRENKAQEDIDPGLFNKAAFYLQHEQGEELKLLLKGDFGSPDDDAILDEQVLNLMHKHMDDLAGVPFLFLSTNKRPISRPSSRASSQSARFNRPDTPNSIPSSPLGFAFKRPFTPLASPKVSHKELGSSYIGGRGSPLASGSPMGSPKLLNAKASEFRPHPRPLSAAGSAPSLLGLRTDASSPDLWSHKTSNLAIAAPLLPDARRPTSSLAKESFPHEDDSSDFDPFTAKLPSSVNSPPPSTSEKEHPSNLTSSSDDSSIQDAEIMTPSTEIMQPFDNLNSIFSSSLSQPEIDEALERNGYDFEATRVWIEANAPHKQSERNLHYTPGSRDDFPKNGIRGRPFYRGGFRPIQPRGSVLRMCRYYMAGECNRVDCRFSHDIDRALCRFWVRGICAKGENCEFLHQLPKSTTRQELRQGLR